VSHDVTANVHERLDHFGQKRHSSLLRWKFSNFEPGDGGFKCSELRVHCQHASTQRWSEEGQQDGTASYAHDSTAGHADFYGFSPLNPVSPPSSIVALTTRGFFEKSDAGSRSGAMQLKSGAFFNSWNPADLLNITLSNSNLTATSTGAGAVRSVAPLTGKLYWEVTIGAMTGGNSGIGLANAAAILSTVGASPSNASVVYNSGNIYVNNAYTGTNISFMPAGTIVCIAVDVTARLIWYRNGIAGNWNNSSSNNPATGVGGISISAITGTLFALQACKLAPRNVTANFGGSAFAGVNPPVSQLGSRHHGRDTDDPLVTGFNGHGARIPSIRTPARHGPRRRPTGADRPDGHRVI
jgi:hypothetical protein